MIIYLDFIHWGGWHLFSRCINLNLLCLAFIFFVYVFLSIIDIFILMEVWPLFCWIIVRSNYFSNNFVFLTCFIYFLRVTNNEFSDPFLGIIWDILSVKFVILFLLIRLRILLSRNRKVIRSFFLLRFPFRII